MKFVQLTDDSHGYRMIADFGDILQVDLFERSISSQIGVALDFIFQLGTDAVSTYTILFSTNDEAEIQKEFNHLGLDMSDTVTDFESAIKPWLQIVLSHPICSKRGPRKILALRIPLTDDVSDQEINALGVRFA